MAIEWSDNLTDDQIKFVRKTCDDMHTILCQDLKNLEKDPDNSQLQIDVCGWEQFCQNIGCEGYEFS